MAKPRLTDAQRAQVMARARSCCEYCRAQQDFSPDSFSIEHIQPRAKGGADALENLGCACQGCNNRKFVSVDAVDPLTGESVSLFHPRQQRWTEHFAWNEDFTLVLGVTPIGRATVDQLEWNRQGLVNLRRVLFAMGEHPPRFE